MRHLNITEVHLRDFFAYLVSIQFNIITAYRKQTFRKNILIVYDHN